MVLNNREYIFDNMKKRRSINISTQIVRISITNFKFPSSVPNIVEITNQTQINLRLVPMMVDTFCWQNLHFCN